MKKYLKTAGNIVMIAALAFVVKKLLDMDIKPSQFRSGKVAAALAAGAVIQTVIMLLASIPWLIFTRSLSGVRISFSAAMPVYTRSNLYKYIPGNVFQYVGRNKLAADMHISHVDVAFATVLDVFFSMVWAGIFSVCLLGGRIAGLLGKYWRNFVIIGAAGTVLLVVLVILVRMKLRDKAAAYIARHTETLHKCDRRQLAGGIFYYFAQYIVSAGMYFLCIVLVVPEASVSEQVALTGAFIFAWIVGFITPGAPGGIGIREGVMIFVSGDKYSDRIVLFVLVMRISSIIADIAAFVVGSLFQGRNTEGKAEHYPEA